MADEVPAVPAVAPAVLAPLIERIRYGSYGLNSVGVIQKIIECVSHNKQIELEMMCTDRFDATVAMENTIVENSRHFKKIEMHNFCNEKDEHRRCFNFFIRIIQGIIGNGKHLKYYSRNDEHEFELEQANQLAEAVVQSSNNNNNDAIESFDFHDPNLTPVTFQLLWNALLDSGVRNITFGINSTRDPPINYNNSNIDFTGIKTNISLKELNLSWYHMREEDFRNLFHAMKVNKGLVGLHFFYTTYEDLPEEMKRLFKEMLCDNSTLLDCRLHRHRQQDRIFEMIQFHMELNRMWKQYVMKRENEKKNPAVIPRREEGDNNNKKEEERKKRLKMRLLLHLFMKKPVMRTTILFHMLSEYPDDLVSNNNNNERQQQNPLLLRIISSNLAKKKRKRTTGTDDDDNRSNDGTDDDPNDNDGVINLCESESEGGTDGTFSIR